MSQDLKPSAIAYHRPLLRLMSGLLVTIFVTGSVAFCDEKVAREELPKYKDMQIPSADALRRMEQDNKEVDWILLKAANPDERQVIIVNPILPRPNTLERMEKEYQEVEDSKPQNEEERALRAKRLQNMKRLLLTLPGDLVTEFRLPVGQIDQIILFEELVLLSVDELIKEGQIRTAYEMLLSVENEIPNWDKSVPRFEQLLLAESSQRAEAGDMYAALAILDEAANRNIKNPALRPRFGEIVGPMIAQAVSAEDFRKARYLMARVEKVFPDHELIGQSKELLQKTVGRFLADAEQNYQQKEYPAAAKLALKAQTVWPLSGNERATVSRFVARHQVLRVGVEDREGETLIYPVPLESQERLKELVEVPLFEPLAADQLTYFRSSYFEIWDPADLGREVVFSLRETRPHWQSQPVLTANDVAEALGHRIDTANPHFSSRLASFVKEVSVRSPTELRVRFSRVPLNIESLMRFPVTGNPEAQTNPEADAVGANVAASANTSTIAQPESTKGSVVHSTRFRMTTSDDSGRTFERQTPEPDKLDLGQYHVAEVQEHSFKEREKLLQAMVRGELDYVPHLQPWEVDAFKASSDFAVRQYAIPMTHMIVFNPMSERIVNAQMRRALSFAINRESLLKTVILRDDAMRFGRPTSAAWHLGSYATEPNQTPPEFNLRLAFALRFSAERQIQLAELNRLMEAERIAAKNEKRTFDASVFRKETKLDHIKLPKLRFVVDPDPACIAAAERMMMYWKRVSFDVELIRGDTPGKPLADSDWDMCYRRVRMEEPLLELWPLLASDDSLDVNRLGMFPDWMRQELINLDYASSFKDARDRLFTIHNHIAAEAFVIPLWEVDDFAVWKKSIIGPPERPMSTYQNVERWIVRP